MNYRIETKESFEVFGIERVFATMEVVIHRTHRNNSGTNPTSMAKLRDLLRTPENCLVM